MTAIAPKTNQRLSSGHKPTRAIPATILGQDEGNKRFLATTAQRISMNQAGSFSRRLLFGPDAIQYLILCDAAALPWKRQDRRLRIGRRSWLDGIVTGDVASISPFKAVKFVRPDNSHGDALP